MRGNKVKRLTTRLIARCLLVLVAILMLAGCFGRSKSPYLVEQYMLEYRPAASEATAPLSEPLRVERFSVAQAFNSSAMVYRQEPFKRAVYEYHRWRVNPGDMVGDLLLRDLQGTGLFLAVFGYREPGRVRFSLEGGVEEFVETLHEDGWKATLVVTVALLDLDAKGVGDRVVFQKRYTFSEPTKGHGPDSFARGMSACMARFSQELTKDTYGAMKTRVAKKA
jgi:ABC-type uncharacterized transport system auxiliary subunit